MFVLFAYYSVNYKIHFNLITKSVMSIKYNCIWFFVGLLLEPFPYRVIVEVPN